MWRCFFTALCFYILIGMSPVRASELLPPELVDTPSLQTSGSLPANPLHPALRILFSGNTRGALFPCPTWGHALMGGMARRAASLERLRTEGSFPVLYIAGAEEFVTDASIPDPAKTGQASPQAVRAIWELLHPDAGYLSQAALRWFGGTPPAGFVPVADRAVTRRLKVGGIAVAIVFFPPLSTFGTEETETPTRALLSQVLAEANASADADIRIGVSPWGFQAEYDVREALSQSFHILLGAGSGAPLVLENDAQAPALLWSRADHDGRSLMILDMLTLPPKFEPPVWSMGVNVVASEERLTQEKPEQPAIRALLEALRPKL